MTMGTWQPIETAPKDGRRVALWIPYTANTEDVCADEGYWDDYIQIWRFDGDDGPFDIQPTKWHSL
jgi:hypothetical protein